MTSLKTDIKASQDIVDQMHSKPESIEALVYMSRLYRRFSRSLIRAARMVSVVTVWKSMGKRKI